MSHPALSSRRVVAERAVRRRWPNASLFGVMFRGRRVEVHAFFHDPDPVRGQLVLSRSLFGIGDTVEAAIEAAQ